MRVLHDVPGPLGLVLFQRFRDVDLWASVRPDKRPDLFAERTRGVELPTWDRSDSGGGQLESPLRVLAALVVGPGAGRESEVAQACTSIAEWASENGHDETAAGFATLASRVRPRDPELAFAAGRAARRLGKYENAEAWFRRAVGLSRRLGNEEAASAAYLGWGVLEELRGRREAARTRFVLAWRAAKRGKLLTLAATARHYMIALTVPDGTLQEGFAHAVAAYKLYGKADHLLPRLASDTGALLSEHGHFSTARLLYEAALPLLTRPAERVAGLANVGRAAAAMGDKQRFTEARHDFDLLAPHGREFLPASLVEMAYGAQTLGQPRQAAAMLGDAIRLAREHRDEPALATALRLEEKIAAKHPGDSDNPAPVEHQIFATRFANRLRTIAAPG
jgi:tetratricopeptide (TPR) repeat protein